MGDELTNAALIALIGAFVLALILRGSGSVAAFLSGTPQPTAGPASGLGVLFKPADPAGALDADGLNPVVYWIVTILLLAMLVVGVAWVWMLLRRHSRKTETDPHRLAGIATAHEVKTTASAKALLRRAGTLRPSLTTPTPEDVGYLLGASRGTGVWASVEDSILLIGPPRSGKTLHVVVNAILDAPGAVVTTSTRPENLTATLRARRRTGGPVAVFDPQHLAEGIPAGLRWSPVRGCEDPLTAMIRANGLAAATGLSSGGVESGGFWEGKTRTALQALLHSAALDGSATATGPDRPPRAGPAGFMPSMISRNAARIHRNGLRSSLGDFIRLPVTGEMGASLSVPDPANSRRLARVAKLSAASHVMAHESALSFATHPRQKLALETTCGFGKYLLPLAHRDEEPGTPPRRTP